MRDTSFCSRVACAIIWSDRRAGETYVEAATRASGIIAEYGRPDVPLEKVLDWACLEKADREMVHEYSRNRMTARQGETKTAVQIHQEVLARLRAEVGLVEITNA